MWLEMQGIKAVLLPFRSDLNSIPSPKDAANLITKKTKAIVLISPNNPTGAIYPPDILSQFFDLAQASKIALIVDETYKDFIETMPPHNIFSHLIGKKHSYNFIVSRKYLALTGYRVGSIIGGQNIINSATKVMDTLAICAKDCAGCSAFWP